MKSFSLLSLILGLVFMAKAQNLDTDADKIPSPDQVQKAIDDFNRLKKEKNTQANEVNVVLDPPAELAPRAIAVDEKQIPEAADPKAKVNAPVLVSGKPPSEVAKKTEEIITDPTDAIIIPPTEEAKPGLDVQVQSIRKGSGTIDPKQIKLKASFPVKPLDEAPHGWQLKPSEGAPSFSREVELKPGTVISLDITPYILSPISDGISTFSVPEPGYESGNAYTQVKTVGAILGKSISQLDEDSVKMGDIISDLHRLLASLPKPETSEKPTVKP